MIIDESRMPVMLYDGDCGFCRQWIDRWQKMTVESLRYEPYQKVIEYYPQVTQDQCRRAVQLIMPDGVVFSGAHAVFKSFSIVNKYRLLLWLYEHVCCFASLSEWSYQLIARHRSFLSRFSRKHTCGVK